MTKHFYNPIVIVVGLLPQILFSQKADNPQNCYRDTFPDKTKVYTRMENKPQFKGGHDSLLNFLITNISFQKLVSDLTQNEMVYADTARVKFIISRDGILSDLSVTLTKNQIFKTEIFSVIKKSSCLWRPGNFGRNIDGWLQLDIYYFITRRYNEVTSRVVIKEYDFETND